MTVVESAQDLLQFGELVDVRFQSLSAQTLDEPREGFESDDVEQSISVQFGAVEQVIEVRAQATVKTRVAEYVVVGVTQFHVQEGVTFAEDVVAEFAEEVGVLAVYPYIREAIQSLTTRLHESPVTMPLMRQAVLISRDPDVSEIGSE